MSEAMHLRWFCRRAEPKDCEAIANIDRQAFSDPWPGAGWLLDLENDSKATLVLQVEAHTSVVGFAQLLVVPPEAELLRLAVSTTHRKRTAGAALLSAALEAARSRQATAMFLEVRESNIAAVRLYKNGGFATVGLRQGYYADGEAALLMRRAIHAQQQSQLPNPRPDGVAAPARATRNT